MKGKFFAGFKFLLPFLLFVVILNWVVGVLFSGIEVLESLRKMPSMENVDFFDWINKALWLIGICIFIWFVGWVIETMSTFPKADESLRLGLGKIVDRIPLLSHLYSITNQVAILQKNSDSFKSVVLVPLLENRAWTVGFITTDKSLFSNYFSTPDEMVSVFMPMTPLTSGLPVTMSRKDIIETNVSVADAIAYIATAGIAGATEKILKESHSDSEWDFFYCFDFVVFLI